MIKHEEVRTSLELMRDDVIDFKDNLQLYYEETHSSYSTDEDYNLIKTYIAEQEKKDERHAKELELLGLYREEHKLRLLISDNETDMVDRTYYREKLSEIVLKIKELEEELKWTIVKYVAKN